MNLSLKGKIMQNSTETRRVRLTITSSHITADQDRLDRYMTMFCDRDDGDMPDGDAVAPEDYPEEMNDALCEIMAQNGNGEDGESSELEEIFKRCGEIVEKIIADKDDEVNALEFCTAAQMTRRADGVIELEYREDESLGNTTTVISYDPEKPGAVSIIHSGSVMSSLICERGIRYISVYNTPIMPFEIAVFTKACDGGFTFEEGGFLKLDYIVELRGADIQRTLMTIKADVI